MADDAVASWLEENGHSGSFFFFKQKTAYEIIAGDWSSDVCSSDLNPLGLEAGCEPWIDAAKQGAQLVLDARRLLDSDRKSVV